VKTTPARMRRNPTPTSKTRLTMLPLSPGRRTWPVSRR
jgi:hypothetical protein